MKVKDIKGFLENFAKEARTKAYARYKDEGTALTYACQVFNLYQGNTGKVNPAKELALAEKVYLFRKNHGKTINLHHEKGYW